MKRLSQERLSALVKEQRNRLDMTQEQLSAKTGINRAMIGRIERNDYIPSIPQLECLAEVLSFDMEHLFVEDRPQVFTAFRGSNLTEQEKDGVDHLFEMMLVAKQQLLLRKALHHDK